MINIFSKKAFRFHNPTPGVGLISKPRENESPEEASKRIAHDSAKLGNVKKHHVLFFDTKPGEMQQAPDWIREDDMFDWAIKDGDLMELASKTPGQQEAEVAAQEQEGSEEAEGDGSEESEEAEGEDTALSSDEPTRRVPPGARRKRVTGK